jgi:DNA polymerase III psi subunit
MMREAILVELGLMPLWQIRAEQPQAAMEYVAIVLQRDDGKTGLFVTDASWTDDVEILFMNVCDALRVHKLVDPQIVSNDLTLLASEAGWLWLAGVQKDACVIAADMPVFTSVKMGELVGNAQLKAGLWTDWCNWRLL